MVLPIFRSSEELKCVRLIEEPFSLDDLVARIKRNEISELNLGYNESNFLHGKRYGVLLEKALRHNNSITSVSIGWRHTNRESLIRLLRAIARNTKLIQLKLVLDDWVPTCVLTDLLQRQQSLIALDLQAVTVLTNKSGKWCCSPKAWSRLEQKRAVNQCPAHNVGEIEPPMDREDTVSCDHSVVTNCILQQYHGLPNLKVLSLVQCDLTDEKIVCLADFLHIRGGVSEVSLRGNRKLTGYGMRIICQAPIMKQLDLSLCDLDSSDAMAVAKGIAARPWPIESLIMTGHYRMGTMGLLALTESACCEKIVSLNMSYCEWKHSRSITILDSLAKLKETTTLRRITLHGSSLSNDLVAKSLQRLLASGVPLRSIQMNDANDPKPMNKTQMRIVAEGVRLSYDLEELVIDFMGTYEERQIWHDINFILRLNKSGRRILRQHPESRSYSGFPNTPDDDWFQVLQKAGSPDEDLTVLFWIVRGGADLFEQREYAFRKPSYFIGI